MRPDGVRAARLGRWRDRVVTADAVYGTILFAALIATNAGDEEHVDGIPGDAEGVQIHLEVGGGPQGDLWEVLLWTLTTLLVFWAAHVYARTIAGHGIRKGAGVPLGSALGDAVHRSMGMIYSAIPATLLLLLGAIGVLPDAADWALWVNVLVLGVLGYQALRELGHRVPARLLGGVVTALFGFVLIVVKVAVH